MKRIINGQDAAGLWDNDIMFVFRGRSDTLSATFNDANVIFYFESV